jgi:hypothetical protein
VFFSWDEIQIVALSLEFHPIQFIGTSEQSEILSLNICGILLRIQQPTKKAIHILGFPREMVHLVIGSILDVDVIKTIGSDYEILMFANIVKLRSIWKKIDFEGLRT